MIYSKTFQVMVIYKKFPNTIVTALKSLLTFQDYLLFLLSPFLNGTETYNNCLFDLNGVCDFFEYKCTFSRLSFGT
jgi:hypothetical protein